MPNLSIITVCYNAAQSIRDCIKSVCNQGFEVEHIIIDGGSDDRTLEILESYRLRVAKLISEPDSGIYDAMNKGLKLVSGDVIGILNADDFYSNSGVLQKVAASFEDEQIESCYGDLVYVDSTDLCKVLRYWRSGSYDRRKFYNGWMPPHPTFFARRSVYKQYGLFNLNLGSAADYELMLRFLLKHKISCKYIPEILVRMRNGGRSNASFKNRLAAHRNDYMAWKANGLKPHPWTLMMKPLRKIGQFITKLYLDAYDSESTIELGVESGTAAGWKVEPGTAVDLGVEPRTNAGVGVELESGLNETVSS